MKSHADASSDAPGSTSRMRRSPFVERTYDETMTLLVEARNYMAHREHGEDRRLDPDVRLIACYESMRVTSRLTQVMAWLLAQKAVDAGEITQHEAVSDRFALSATKVCLDREGQGNPDLPSGLRSLLDRSHRLYVQVSRLESMVRSQLN
jgi:regulator of CtrA degradation